MSAPEPLRVAIGPAGVPPLRNPGDGRVAIDFVRRLEDLGYAALAVGDHLDDRGAPLPLLAAAAQATSRLILAAHVLCNEFRNPTVLAQEVRTIQVLSDGRLELGLGVGWLEKDFEAAGIAFDSFGARLGRLEATVAMLRSGTVQPAPPIVIGGGGPRMLTAAARLADVVTFNIPLGRPKDIGQVGIAQGVQQAFEERLALVRGTAAAAGRSVRLHAFVHHVHMGPAWREEAEQNASRTGLALDDYLGSPHVLAGDVERVAATVQDRRDRYGLHYFSVPGAAAEQFAPVLARLG